MGRAGERAIWAGPGACWRRSEVDGAHFRWVEAGSGPPLLLLHGYGGSAHWWARNIEALGVVRRVYALDLPGFGRSRMAGRFTFSRSAELLARWLDQRGIASADVVAHSMGGQLALILAAQHPSYIRSLVLAAPAGLPFDTGLPGIALRAMRSRRGGDPRFTPIVVRGVILAGPRVLWQAVQQIMSVDVRQHISTVAAPTLILWGECDGLLSPANGPILAAGMTGARLHVVPGGRHNLMWEQADMFNEALVAFLTEGSVGNAYPIGDAPALGATERA